MTINIEEQPIENAYSYSRISRGSQSKGFGLTRQDEKAVAICKEKGWELDPKTLVDLGYSGYKGENLLIGALKNFIDAAKTGKLLPHPVLIIEQWDRFSRMDIDQSEPHLLELLKGGVAIHNSFNGKTYTKASTKDLASRIEILIGFKQAWEYSNNLSKRVNDAFQRKYAQAAEGKPVQLGYWQPAWVDFIGEKKSVGAFDKNEIAAVVYNIVQDYLSGKSMLQIANRLNAAKTPCIGKGKKKGKQWSQGQISYLLTSESLIGSIVINGHRFDHYYPAIISDDEWLRLQSKLQENKNRKGGTRAGQWISNLFPNRVKCACCKGAVSTQNGKCGNVVQRYYKCLQARVNKEKCKVRMMLPISDIEEDFFLLFLQQHPSELMAKNTTDHQTEIAKLDAEVKKVESLIEEAVDLLGKIPAKALEKKLATLNSAKKDLEQKRETLNRSLMAMTNTPEAMRNIKEVLSQAVTDDVSELDETGRQLQASLSNPEVRQKLVKLLPTLVDHITIDLVQGSYSVTTTDNKTTKFRSVIHQPTIE